MGNHLYSHRTLSILVLLLLLFPAEFITIIPKQSAHATPDWFNNSWSYRKQHNITGSTAGLQTDYPVEIDVGRDTGYTDSGKRVYTGTKAKSDYGDIRFTKSNGTTELSYWLEETVTGRDRFTVFDKSEFNNPMSFPQYGSSGAVHPDVHYFASAIDGYHYWAVYTPNPSPDATKEKPSIVRSNDGITWTSSGITNPVVSLGASTIQPDPDMIYVGSLGKWFMVSINLTISTRSSIMLSYSSNGKNWTNYDGVAINNNTNPIIISGTDSGGQSWEKNGSNSKLQNPALAYDNGTFYVYYSSWKEGNNRGKVGYATFNWENSTDDIENFTRYASNPVIDLAADATFKSGIGHIDIVKNGTTYYMYGVREDLSSTNYEMALLTSSNFTTWAYQGRVVSRGTIPSMFDYKDVYRGSILSDGEENVVFLGGVTTLYYAGYDYENNPKIGAAVGTGNFARFWVEVDSIAASPSITSIYMYYGNSGASTTSNHTNTMIKADDGVTGNFDTDIHGSATLTHSSGYYKSTEDSTDDGFAAGKVMSNWNFMATIRVFRPFTTSSQSLYGLFDESVESNLVGTIAASGGKRRLYLARLASNDPSQPNYFQLLYQDSGGTYRFWNSSLGWVTTTTSYASTGDLEIRLWSDGTNLYIMVYGGNEQMYVNPATIAISSVKSFSQGKALAWTDLYTDAYILTQEVDRYFVRKYVSPEPTHGVWGSEESMAGVADLVIHVLNFGGNNLIAATYIGYNGSSIQAVNSTGYVTFTNLANQSVIVLNRNIWENSSTSNGWVKVNSSNSVSVTMTGTDKTVAIKLSVYLVNLSFKDRNGTAVTPSNMSMTFGHNNTLKTFTTYSFLVANYSNTPSRIYKWNSNVRHNVSDSFTASAYNANYTYDVKIAGRTPYWRDFNGDTVSNSHLATTYSITFPNGTLKSSLTPGTTYKMQNGSSTVTNPLWQSMNVTQSTRVFDPYLYKPNFTLRIQNHSRSPADYFGLNSSMTKFKVGSSPSYVLQNGVNISYVYDGSSVVYFNHSPVLPIVNMTVQIQTQSNLTATIQDSSASYVYKLIWLGGVGNVTTTTTTTTTTHTTTSTTSIQNIVCPTYTPNINYTFFDGFESGDFSKWNSTASGTTGTINVTSHNPVNGTYSEYVNIGSNANGFGYAVGTANLTSLGNSIWLQLYIRINPMVHSPNQEFHFLSLRNSSGAFLKMGIFHEGTEAHELEVELIDPVLGTVTLHSTDIGFDANSVQRIELGFFKNSTVGYVHAYVNGTQVINYDNIKSDYSAYNFTNFRVGAFENGAGIHHYNVTIDNVGLSNSRIGLPQYTCAFVAASYYGGNTPLGLIFVLLGMTMGAVLLIKRKRQI